MIFSSLDFIIFFALLLTMLYIIKNDKARKIIILTASYFFYGYWDYRFLSLIIFSTFLDYFVGRALDHNENARKRKLLLFISVFCNLGLLGFFKYYNFFIDTFNAAFGLNAGMLNIILPVGISFYTFQTMSYTIDVYRKKMKHTDNVIDFAIFVAFFPQLVAGPIVRAADFLPQLKKKIILTGVNFQNGLQIFLFGMVKKVLVADRLAYFVDNVFAAPGVYNTWTVWLAVVAYSIQIYCDFSGYSDMAIGLARIMGFSLTKNFDLPYISKNPTEFWHRWHISLSSWLKDYLYIPLGGNRKGKVRQNINLMLTMVLGGLWHGANLTFVFWGFLHGSALVVHKFFVKLKNQIAEGNAFLESNLYKAISWLLTYVFVLICWVFFRAQTFDTAFLIIGKMFAFEAGIKYYYTAMIYLVPLFVFVQAYKFIKKEEYFVFDLTTYKGLIILIGVVMLIFYFAPTTPSPFIYFQF